MHFLFDCHTIMAALSLPGEQGGRGVVGTNKERLGMLIGTLELNP